MLFPSAPMARAKQLTPSPVRAYLPLSIIRFIPRASHFIGCQLNVPLSHQVANQLLILSFKGVTKCFTSERKMRMYLSGSFDLQLSCVLVDTREPVLGRNHAFRMRLARRKHLA